jgi:hypothetical protein
MSKRANEPAMPVKRDRYNYNNPDDETFAGLTLREHFAGLAMQGLLVNASVFASSYTDNRLYPSDPDRPFREHAKEAAKTAIAYADALLAELERTP